MSYFEEYDPFTGERSSFGGIAEAAEEYHRRGEPCPFDCWRCDVGSMMEHYEEMEHYETRAVEPDWGNLPEPPF